MKKFKRIDFNLFSKLKLEKANFNMDGIKGGEIIATSGNVNFTVGNTIYTKRYTDKQDCVIKDGKVISGGCCYDFVFSDGKNFEPKSPDYEEAKISFDESYNYY